MFDEGDKSLVLCPFLTVSPSLLFAGKRVDKKSEAPTLKNYLSVDNALWLSSVGSLKRGFHLASV